MKIIIEGYMNRKAERTFYMVTDIPSGFFDDNMVDVEKIEKKLGNALRSALTQSIFIVVRRGGL